MEADSELSTNTKGRRKVHLRPEKKLTLLQKGNRQNRAEQDGGPKEYSDLNLTSSP